MCQIIPLGLHRLQHWEGLASCSVCGGAEGRLPEHCPGRRMTDEEQEAVYAGEIDFRRSEGGWTSWTRDRRDRIRRMTT